MIFRYFYYLCIMRFRSRLFLMFACAAAVSLAGCIKMPESNGSGPGGPDGPDEPDNPGGYEEPDPGDADGMTREEQAKQIQEKEQKIKDLDLEKRKIGRAHV